MIVPGEVVIDADCSEFEKAVAFIYLEDVSLVDASARRVSSTKLTNIQHSLGREDRVPFEIVVDLPPDSHATYILRAHVALHGSTDVEVNDLITVEHIPVDLKQLSNRIEVRVRPVG